MPLYESTFIARPDISSNEVEKLTGVFSKIIDDNGGRVVSTEYWGLRNLAYVINKNKKGHYVMLSIEAPSVAVKEMERRMKINEDVIRNVTFRVSKIDNEPSVMMKSSSGEDEVIEEMKILTNDNNLEGE